MPVDERKPEKQIDAWVRTQVALAGLPAAAIVAATVEYLADVADPASVEARAWPAVTENLTAHLAAQAGWPAVTDNDRLTNAFRALNDAGVVARENFTCCQNCGVADIGAEVADGGEARGYAFYHQQDTERAAQDGSLWNAYGLIGGPPSPEIGTEVAAALRPFGWWWSTAYRSITWSHSAPRTGR